LGCVRQPSFETLKKVSYQNIFERKKEVVKKKMHLQQVSIEGDDFIGLFGFSTDKYAFLSEKFPKKIKKILKIENEARTKIYGTSLLGLFCAGNSNGILLPYFVPKRIIIFLKKSLPMDINIGIVQGKYTAIGNLIASNDFSAIISPKIEDINIKLVEDILDVEVFQGELAGYSEVGSCCVVTNKGFLVHPDVNENELKKLKEIFKVSGGATGTVNFGFPYPKAGLIANSHGYLAGKSTSGIELGRIDEALGFL
jgi:translation initiation factor 6